MPSSTAEPLLQVDEQPAQTDSGFARWQSVIWREWSHCEDEDYTHYLFHLIKATAFGWKFVITIAGVGTLLGGWAGYLLGSMFVGKGIYFGRWDFSALPPVLLALTVAITGGMLGIEGSRRFRALYFWWQGQPSASRVIKALQQAIVRYPGAEDVWAEPLRRLEQQQKQPGQLEQLITMLQSPEWVDRFVAGKTLVLRGGEVTEALRQMAIDTTKPGGATAVWLLAGIEQETSNRFAWRTDHTLCPRCLTRFGSHSIEVDLGISFACYGCRVCRQSQKYLYLPKGVVAVLDAAGGRGQVTPAGRLKVNWLHRRTLFDFDWVEIIRATDEDVERFAVQVGNDTDPFRQPRYQDMRCLIDPACQLSENTLRILRRMLGEVRHAPLL
ncbi:MAG: hypothetical protein JXM69_15565 [Anaerolineae bacterium]|nr:hypothetical protein [Anaerolineae bacterium]